MSALKRQNAFYGASNYKKTKGPSSAAARSYTDIAVRKLKRQLESERELKEYTQGSGVTGIAPAGTVQSLFTLNAGTDSVGNRIGRKATYKKMVGAIACCVGTGVTPVTSYDVITVAVWLDRQANTGTAAFNQIWDLSTGIGLGGMAHKNTAQNDERFKCLWMKTYTISYQSPSVVDRFSLNLDKLLKGKDKTCEFVSSAGSIPQTSGLFLTYASINGTPTTVPNISFNIKTRYMDD